MLYLYIGVGKDINNRWNIPIAFKNEKEANLFIKSKPELLNWKPSFSSGGIIPGHEWIVAFDLWSKRNNFDLNLLRETTKGGNKYALLDL